MPVRSPGVAARGLIRGSRMSAVVVGGGITGLVAAYDLALAGVPVTLVEAAPRLGGKVATQWLDGHLIESGPDSFVTLRPQALALVHELGLADALVTPSEPRVVHVVTGGKLVRMPDGTGLGVPTKAVPLLASAVFSIPEKLRIGLDLALPRGPLEGDVAVGAVLRRRFGDALVDRLAGPLLGGVYGTPVDELSALATVPGLRTAERSHRSLLLAALASRRTNGTEVARSPLVTLANGMGQLVEALVAVLERSPLVAVRTRSAVQAIERRGGGADVILEGGEAIAADAVVFTVPGPIASRLLSPSAPAAAAHVRSIPHGSTTVVSLAYDRAQFAAGVSGHGFLIARDEPLLIDACTFSSLKWTGRAPEGHVLLRAFVGARQPGLQASPDDVVARSAHDDLARLLHIEGGPHLTHVTRWTRCMPQYTVGHLDRVAAATAALAETPYVLAGASYLGAGLPQCIAQGRTAAARALLTGLRAPSGRARSRGTNDPTANAPVLAEVGPKALEPSTRKDHAR